MSVSEYTHTHTQGEVAFPHFKAGKCGAKCLTSLAKLEGVIVGISVQVFVAYIHSLFI